MKVMSSVHKAVLALVLFSAAAFGQYKAESVGAPPPEVASPMAQVLQKDGIKISNNGAPYCEIWFRTGKIGGGATEENATMPGIPIGTFLGVIRFEGKGSDRRGQNIKAGVYTLRYGLIPINGDHQGAAPQRDFLVLVPASDDKDVNATPKFEELVGMSKKASGTPHPAVLSFWKAEGGGSGISQQGDDWVLQTKLGDVPIAVILIGTASS